jgi:general secretion pathway protein A
VSRIVEDFGQRSSFLGACDRTRFLYAKQVPDSSKQAQPLTAWEAFHGLSTAPFSLAPDLRFVYHSRSHTRAVEQVTTALGRREGLIVITGETGTGKTMLCRTLLETFSEARTFLSVILDPGLSAGSLLYQVLTDFGLVTAGDRTRQEPLADLTRQQLVATLQQFLTSLIPLNAHAVIVIDEAQHLSSSALEDIRLLSNFETDQAKLLQIVLVGQPDLDDVLQTSDMEQFAQRIARRFELQPLSSTEVQDYIDRRLFVAAGLTSAGSHNRDDVPPDHVDQAPGVEFSPPAIQAVVSISKGVPRVVNTLCDRSLEVAFERETHAIDASIVREAARQLMLTVPAFTARSGAVRAGAAAASIVLAGALGAYFWLRPVPAPPGEPDATPEVAAPAQTPPPPSDRPAASGEALPGPAAPAVAPPASDTKTAYQVAVAAFRTERRASQVSATIAAQGLPVSTRSTAAGAWYQVVVGPFATAEAAESAQRRLALEGFGDARVSAVVADERR